VIDDQSDWYDADATSMMWLSEKERAERISEQVGKGLRDACQMIKMSD
jgi:hypothetical protein